MTLARIISGSERMNHAPMLTRKADGSLFACWYAGSGEGRADVAILGADADAEGLSWSTPRTLVAAGEQAVGARFPPASLGNPVPHTDALGRLWLFYGVVEPDGARELGLRSWRCNRIDSRYSTDQGATWSQPLRLVDEPGALPRARPLERAGELLLPAYLEGGGTSFLVRIALSGANPARLGASIGPGVLQPTLTPGADGKVRAYFRDSHSKRVRTALYDPDGDAWSPLQATNLPNPDSSLDALALPDGRVLVIYNPSETDRNALALAVSSDGVQFAEGHILAEGPGAVAYPSIALTPAGAVVALYSAGGKRDIWALRLFP